MPRGTVALCIQLCEEDDDCGMGVCAGAVRGSSGQVTQFGRCTSSCNPVLGADTICPEGTRCSITVVGDPPRTVTDCVSPIGTLTEEGCTRATDCAEGHGCVGGRCREICDPAGNTCTAPETCEPVRVETGEYGVCA